jgi:hypothetical protein
MNMKHVWVFTKAVISSYLSRKISSVILRIFQGEITSCEWDFM